MAKQKESSKAKVKTKPLPQKKIKQRDQIKKGAHGGTQVVLIEDVLHVGKQGQTVEVKPGFARNYLLPNGMAVMPSEHNVRLLERYKVRVEKAHEAKRSDLKSLAEQIARTRSVTIEANAMDDGHLYGSVGPQEITRAMRGKNLLVEPEMIKLDEHLKVCAIHPDIRVVLGYDIECKIEVVIIPQSAGRR